MPGFPKPEFTPHTHVAVKGRFLRPYCASCGRGLAYILEDNVCTIVRLPVPLVFTNWRETRLDDVGRA